MGDHCRVDLGEFPHNNRAINPNPYSYIPPPPLPPGFPPPNMPPVPSSVPFPPPNMPPVPLPAHFPPPNMPPVPSSAHFPPPNMPPVPSSAPFPPPNMPLVSSSAPFPLPSRPSYPPYVDQRFPPPTSARRNVPSWNSGPSHPTSIPPKQQPLREPRIPDTENPQDWVDYWTKGKRNLDVVKNNVKIYKVKENLNAAFKLVRELENSSRTLGVMVKTVTSEEWEQKCHEVEEKKLKLLNLLNEMKLSAEDFKLLRGKLSKRTKKRARLRRQSERLQKRKEEEKVKTQNLNFQIDNWQREMQERVERVKREEDLKKEADAVLWGVTQKMSEAKRQVAMLSALLTLRSVRVARLTAAGLSVSQSQIDTFNTVIVKLKNMWSRHLEQCRLEEQALRGMLGIDSQDCDVALDDVKTHKKLVLNEWETAVFGSVGSVEPLLKADELIDIRRSWDRFALREPSLLASGVPPGYVLPVSPSSDLWRSFLKY